MSLIFNNQDTLFIFTSYFETAKRYKNYEQEITTKFIETASLQLSIFFHAIISINGLLVALLISPDFWRLRQKIQILWPFESCRKEEH